jgi:hypothetical protein
MDLEGGWFRLDFHLICSQQMLKRSDSMQARHKENPSSIIDRQSLTDRDTNMKERRTIRYQRRFRFMIIVIHAKNVETEVKWGAQQ